MPQFHYKKVLVFGATSGIGKALAEKFVQNGTSVIVVGRREDALKQFVQEHSSQSNASVDHAVFDITNLGGIPKFADEMFSKHPDLDSVWFNSGLQRGVDWSKPEKVDLDMMDMEFKTNYTSYMHLTKAFMPYLEKQKTPASLIYTTSGLALVPLWRCPNYCASKAALHHMVLAMRQQLKQAKSNVRVIELMPPAVQTELHDAKHQPDIKDGGNIGMPLKDFTDEAFEKLCKDGEEGEEIRVEKTNFMAGDWENERQKKMFMINGAH